MARRDAALRASVFSATRSVPHTSNARVRSRSLQAGLTPVRWQDAAYQVLPISATDGGASSAGSGPRPTPGGQAGGHAKTSRSRNLVQPTIRSSARLRTASGTPRPPAWSARAAAT
jgi:hypothetical protein